MLGLFDTVILKVENLMKQKVILDQSMLALRTLQELDNYTINQNDIENF